MDEKETTAHVNRCFELADKVVELAEDKTKGGSLNPTDRIFIAALSQVLLCFDSLLIGLTLSGRPSACSARTRFTSGNVKVQR